MYEKTRRLRLALYGISHLIVDMCCFYILYAAVITNSYGGNGKQEDTKVAVISFLLYNCAAFGLQIVFGRIADKKGGHRAMAVTGCALLVAAMIWLMVENFNTYHFFHNTFGLVSMALAAVGNALFHTGGGVDTLISARGKMTPNGLFVAPGAIGVALGRYIGRSFQLYMADNIPKADFVCFLMLLAAVVALVQCVAALCIGRGDNTEKAADVVSYRVSSEQKSASFIIIAAITVVVLRALVGSYMPTDPDGSLAKELGGMLPVIFASCAALGKALGGIFGDIFGARKISVISLSASAVLLVCGIWLPEVTPIAVLLFNFTMPITLCVCASEMPGRYGEAFGLTTFGLLIGSLPDYLLKLSYYPRLCVSLPLIVASAALMYICCAGKNTGKDAEAAV